MKQTTHLHKLLATFDKRELSDFDRRMREMMSSLPLYLVDAGRLFPALCANAAIGTMKPDDRVTVDFTIVEATSDLTKSMRVENGNLVKKAAVSPARGTYESITRSGTPVEILAGNIYGLKSILESLGPRQALIASPLPSPVAPDGNPWGLRRKADVDDGKSLPRTKATFKRTNRVGLGFLDFDIPEPLRLHLRNPQELHEILRLVWLGFGRVALLIRLSVSSGVKLQGQPDPPPSGFHAFFVASDGEKLGKLADLLFDRLALMGAAIILPSRRGSRLRRALVDPLATKGPERLIFEADAVLVGPGLERVPRETVVFGGSILDMDAAIAALTLSRDDKLKLAQIWRDAEEKATPELVAARLAWLGARTSEIAAERKLQQAEARRIAERERAQFDAGELRDGFEIMLDDGRVVTPYDILIDPDRFKGARGYSLDEHTPRPGVVFLWPYPSRPDPKIGKPPGPWLHTFEHGGRYFRLRSLRADVERHRVLVERQRALVEKFFVEGNQGHAV